MQSYNRINSVNNSLDADVNACVAQFFDYSGSPTPSPLKKKQRSLIKVNDSSDCVSMCGLDDLDIKSCVDQAEFEIVFNHLRMGETDTGSVASNQECPTPMYDVADDSYYAPTPSNLLDVDYSQDPTPASSFPHAQVQAVQQYELPRQQHVNMCGYSVNSILNQKHSIRELLRLGVLERLMEDRTASKELMSLIHNGRSQRISRNNLEQHALLTMMLQYFQEHRVDLCRMSDHIYANHVIQCMFRFGTEQHHVMMLKAFGFECALRMSQTKYGCRVVQTILRCLQSKKLLCEFVKHIEYQCSHRSSTGGRNAISKLICGGNSHHVVHGLLRLELCVQQVAFIRDELESNLVHYAKDGHGCRVIQSFVDHYGAALNVLNLTKDDNHVKLCYHPYGNYVIQHIVAGNQWFAELPLIAQFRNVLLKDMFSRTHVLDVSQSKQGSNAMETCVRSASKAQLHSLIDVLVARRAGLLRRMIAHRFANFVPNTLLKIGDAKQKMRLVAAVDKHIQALNQCGTNSKTGSQQSGERRFVSCCRQFADNINEN